MKRIACGVVCAATLLASACGPGLNRMTPTEPVASCSDVHGSYKLTYGDSCGRFGGDIAVTLKQTACAVTADLPGIGKLAGKVSGTGIDLTLTYPDPCPGTATGTAKVVSRVISGSYAGTIPGAGACCTNVAGTLTLTPAA